MFLPQQERVMQFVQPDERQIDNSSFSKHFVEEIENIAVPLDETAVTEIATTPYRGHTENLRRYEQALVAAIVRNYVIDDHTRKSLQSWQHFLGLTDEDIEPIETRIQGQIKVAQRSEKHTRVIRSKNVLPVKVIKQAITNNQTNQPRLGNDFHKYFLVSKVSTLL